MTATSVKMETQLQMPHQMRQEAAYVERTRSDASLKGMVLVELALQCLHRGQYKAAVRRAYLYMALGGRLPDATIAPLQSAIARCRSSELDAMWVAASNWAASASGDHLRARLESSPSAV